MNDYLEAQNVFGARKGDTIFVFCSAKTRENGWANSWVPAMDDFIGRYGKVVCTYGPSGIMIDFPDSCHTYCFPYFCCNIIR